MKGFFPIQVQPRFTICVRSRTLCLMVAVSWHLGLTQEIVGEQTVGEG
jgi:hypothetical protein